MSILATELDWPEGTKFFEVQCRLGIWDVDGWDLDKEPEVKTLGGTVRITPRTPAGRIRLLEPDGKYRVVVAPPLTFAINEFTGKLVNTADNTEGVWVVDPASDTVDPKDFTYSAVVNPKVGSPFTVEFDGTVAINGVYDLANGTTVAPSRGVSVLESRIAKLEQEGGLPQGDIPIFATLDEAMAYERENPGNLALTIESTEPDTTPPTLGTLTITPEGTKATAVVSGAKDDRGTVEYSFKLDYGAWSGWQTEARYTFAGLSLSTGYSAMHRVRDRAGNTVEGYSQSFTTLNADLWGTLWVDSFANNTDGPLVGQTLDSPSSAVWQELHGNSGPVAASSPIVQGGLVKPGTGQISAQAGQYPVAFKPAVVQLPVTPRRVAMSFTALGNQAGRSPRPIAGGTDATHFHCVYINARGGEPLWDWITVDGATSGTGSRTRIPEAVGVAGWVEKTWTLEVDHDTRALTFKEGDKLLLEWTIPAEEWHGGGWYGFDTSNLIESSQVIDFSIRWE